MIIDTGSSANIVSKGLVHMIGLSIEKPPSPYKIWWIKKAIEK